MLVIISYKYLLKTARFFFLFLFWSENLKYLRNAAPLAIFVERFEGPYPHVNFSSQIYLAKKIDSSLKIMRYYP